LRSIVGLHYPHEEGRKCDTKYLSKVKSSQLASLPPSPTHITNQPYHQLNHTVNRAVYQSIDRSLTPTTQEHLIQTTNSKSPTTQSIPNPIPNRTNPLTPTSSVHQPRPPHSLQRRRPRAHPLRSGLTTHHRRLPLDPHQNRRTRLRDLTTPLKRQNTSSPARSTST
jgi:hypothetical protein